MKKTAAEYRKLDAAAKTVYLTFLAVAGVRLSKDEMCDMEMMLDERIAYYSARHHAGLSLWEDRPAPKGGTNADRMVCFGCGKDAGLSHKAPTPPGWSRGKEKHIVIYHCPVCVTRYGDVI